TVLLRLGRRDRGTDIQPRVLSEYIADELDHPRSSCRASLCRTSGTLARRRTRVPKSFSTFLRVLTEHSDVPSAGRVSRTPSVQGEYPSQLSATSDAPRTVLILQR